MTVDTFKNLKIRRLELENFKLFDNLTIEFPAPEFKGDPDVIVLGSKNGQGKTTVMEAIALSYLSISALNDRIKKAYLKNNPVFSRLVKSGCERASICCNFYRKPISFSVKSMIDQGAFYIEPNSEIDPSLIEVIKHSKYTRDVNEAVNQALGLRSEPLIAPYMIFLHSYRKTPEGKPDLGNIMDERNKDERGRYPIRSMGDEISRLKTEIVKLLMREADLFDGIHGSNKDDLQFLNRIMLKYTKGSIHKLKSQPDSTIDILIKPEGGGPSYSFDGLSSGQKEMIASLFTIWQNTKDRPGIVMIDEPELHLNSIWHKDMVNQLFDLCPDNQYILATHSEHIFNSVDPSRRIILNQKV